MFQYCLNSVLKHAKRVYFAQYKKMLHNTKNFELILVYWFLQKRLFADSIKEKEKAELEKMKKNKKKIDTEEDSPFMFAQFAIKINVSIILKMIQ